MTTSHLSPVSLPVSTSPRPTTNELAELEFYRAAFELTDLWLDRANRRIAELEDRLKAVSTMFGVIA